MKEHGTPSSWILAACAAALSFAVPVGASTWSGGTTNWNNNGNPGWNGTGVPNGVGAIAAFTSGGTTTQELSGGVTVGIVSLTGSPTTDRQIQPGGGITFNQDGAGAGTAVISNDSAKRISFNTAGPITLADDLLIVNTGSGTSTYSVSITSTIGGIGNLTLDNVSNDPTIAPLTLGAANTFTGSVLIARGGVTIAVNTGMGYAGNVVTLGSAGKGSAAFVTTGSAVTFGNPINVASGTGGTLLLGSTSAAATDSAYTNTVTLNGDVSVTSSKAAGATVKFTKVISGGGALTKIGTGQVTFTTNNTYSGGTTVSNGTLALSGASALGSGVLQVISGAVFQVTNANSTVGGVVTNSGSIQVFNSGLSYTSNVVLNGGSSYLSLSGTNIFNNGLTINAGVNFNADAASLVSVLGNYQNLGSSVFSNRYTVASGSRYRSSGGATNQFAGGLAISSGSGFDVTNGQSVISGTITNAGTMTVFNARAIYNGNVVNQGAYVSDPSTNTFNGNFTVGPTATVVAAAGDVYAFGSNFVMQSTNRNFNMSSAQVVFAGSGYGITTGTTNHILDLTGSSALDKGSNWLNIAQLATNFSLGTLSVSLGNSLQVTGGAANALYVGTLDVGGLGTNLLGAVLDLDVNLYYDEHLAGNAYLGGQTYQFAGWQGFLIPIPEPTSCLAMVAGLALLGVIRRSRVPRV